MVNELFELFERCKDSETAEFVVKSFGSKSAAEKLGYGSVDSYSVADLDFFLYFFVAMTTISTLQSPAMATSP